MLGGYQLSPGRIMSLRIKASRTVECTTLEPNHIPDSGSVGTASDQNLVDAYVHFIVIHLKLFRMYHDAP